MMFDEVSIVCPYCFETVEILLDPHTRGELVRDCEVCCNPWTLNVLRDREGHPEVRVDRLQ